MCVCQEGSFRCHGMSLIMEEVNSLIDPREEVKKLQELVRKLEHQLNVQQQNNRSHQASHHTGINGSDNKKILDEVDLINIEDLELSDEDSWLYLSPKGLSPEERAVSAYKWLRKDVEDPHNRELQMAKRELVYKLDELAILSPVNHQRGGFPQNGSLAFGHGVDSRTFTRPKKRREDVMDGSIDGQPQQQRANRAKMDFINVQEIARMQEESLRHSSPGSTPKRNSVSSLTSSGRRLSTSSRNSTDSEPPSENAKPGNGSSHSTPPESPVSFSVALNKSGHPSLSHLTGESHRSSMPNLVKGNGLCERPRQVSRLSSPSRIGMYSANASISPVRGERRLAAPSRSSTNLRNLSPVRSYQKVAPEPQRTPQRQSAPPPSRITRIPSPKSRLAVPSRIGKPNQSTWNDGCF